MKGQAMVGTVHVGETQIVRMAAIHIGDNASLQSINDGSALVSAFRDVWDMAIEATLVAHPWNPAVQTRPLDRDSVAPPDNRYAYRYDLSALPDGWLRWLPWARSDCDWFEGEEESGYLLTNEPGPLSVRYIWRNSDVSRWSPGMRLVMANRLAYWTAFGRSQLLGVADRMETALGDTLIEAKRLDGLSSGNVSRGHVTATSRFAAARRSAARPR
jgi:hypothetical protein